MRTYSKPVAEIENFSLDAQFAEGGCASASEAIPSDYTAALDAIDMYNDIKSGPYATLVEAWMAAKGIAGQIPTTNDMINDFAWFLNHDQTVSTDNPTSGRCYFTLNNAFGKSFS